MKIRMGTLCFLLSVISLCTSFKTPSLQQNTPTVFIDDSPTISESSEAISPAQVKVIGEIMASHPHRLYHALWHATRNGWNQMSHDEQESLQNLSQTWGKHAPLCKKNGKPFAPDSFPPSGEEFLYMHHGMIQMLNTAFAGNATTPRSIVLPGIKAWKELPTPNDPLWPIPTPIDENDQSKTYSTYDLMKSWSEELHDPNFLKGKSLSYIGFLVENSIHNFMHMRWAKAPLQGQDFSPLDPFLETSFLNDSPFDAPEFNWLGTPYSAHVNPIFWKLHGWVDDTIPLWLTANGYEQISKDCSTHGPHCYQWRSTWEGEVPALKTTVNSEHFMLGMHHTYSHVTPSLNSKQLQAIHHVLGFGNFRNSKFESFQKNHVQSQTQTAPSTQRNTPQSPEALDLHRSEIFVKNFGPCSGR